MLWLPSAQSQSSSGDDGRIPTEGELALCTSLVSHQPCEHISEDGVCFHGDDTCHPVYNDLKQFTVQLKQDLACDNAEETVTY